MKRPNLYILLLFFLLLLPIGQTTANGNDSIRLSLLTCAPGEEIYSLFGHTAIRYEDPANGIDAVFNYGLFSFNTPNFIFRFSLGETDYQLGATDYAHFAAEYAFDGRSVWQQTLNLSKEEKAELIRTIANIDSKEIIDKVKQKLHDVLGLDKNRETEPECKKYILANIKEAFCEQERVRTGESKSRPAEELLAELIREREGND